MQQRQWKAIWTSREGHLQEYIFQAPDHRGIAGIDFKLKLMSQGKPVPAFFELEEGRRITRVVPRLRDVEGRR